MEEEEEDGVRVRLRGDMGKWLRIMGSFTGNATTGSRQIAFSFPK